MNTNVGNVGKSLNHSADYLRMMIRLPAPCVVKRGLKGEYPRLLPRAHRQKGTFHFLPEAPDVERPLASIIETEQGER
jgi:hypothetical protein